MSDAPVELGGFYALNQFEPETFEGYADLVFASAKTHEQFESLTRDIESRQSGDAAASLALGVGYLILGRYREALDAFSRAPDNKYRHFYAGEAAAALGRFDEAINEYQAASAKGWDAFEADMRIAAVRVRAGDPEAAEKIVKKHERGGADRAGWYYVQGLIDEAQGGRESALALYQKAVALGTDHLDAMFRAARLLDMLGEDDDAVRLYEQLAMQPRAYINAVINLAVLYEDRGRYDLAVICLRRVLAAFPNHTRARLFLKDAESSRAMLLDEAAERPADSRSRLLETSINEFELSMRARNALRKMKINTLGDLIKLNEVELMAYKNFGETSLNEVKALLAKKGLRLGQTVDEIDPTVAAVAAPAEPAPQRPLVPPGQEALLTKPVSELELSVRARRCLQRLSIATIGDLLQHTEAELLATRNFGQTSLNEIRQRLGELNLNLQTK